jgi:hypothetical protein
MPASQYPEALEPDSYELHTIDGENIQIPVVHLKFKKWQGEPIANTFGGKGLIDYQGEAMFAELAIKRGAETDGWQARWVETYAMKGKMPYYFSQWGDGALPTQIQDPITDEAPLASLARVAKQNNGSYSGCWDVVVWKDEQVTYVEAKRIKKDAVRITQDRWLDAGLKAGLSPENFMIAWWDFE